MDSAILNSSFGPLRVSIVNNRTSFSSYNSFSLFKFNRSKSSSITVSYNSHSNPRRPKSKWGKCLIPTRPSTILIPILHSLRDFAVKTSTTNWASALLSDAVPDELKGECLKNGGFGMALLSVTATAKVRISPFVVTLASNPTFVSGLLALFVAQSTKVFLNFFVDRKWDMRILFASGGMPSSHSALCTALTASVAICHGVADSLFPVCLGFSSIVMYDAIGVRRHAGMQAEVLNMILQDLFQGHPISQRKLKELLGHTPSQVVAGALLGILVACFCCQSCLVAT